LLHDSLVIGIFSATHFRHNRGLVAGSSVPIFYRNISVEVL